MKIDHLVVNVDKSFQESKQYITSVHSIGLPYMPKWGKGTKGFKVSNLWMGKEYFELVHIKKADGGGWVKEWTNKYNEGHRGLVGFALEVENIDEVYQKLTDRQINVTFPEPLRFRWFFNLLNKTMPWRNSYLPTFKGVPFQFFLQQLNDEKSKSFMEQYMVPNSSENGIEGILEVTVYGRLEDEDRKIIYALFDDYEEQKGALNIALGNQTIRFIESSEHRVEVKLRCNNESYAGKKINIHNIQITNT
ncbi:VOC family protein [Paenibacillus tundrae]|uniref:VOC family protein n=1 Tax=Paenibacillus tundrae TaxID=528187 RepID=UPI0030CE61F4